MALVKEKGYRETGSRRKIIRVLSNKGHPLTPREIREAIKGKPPDLSTVYRDLSLFEKLRIVRTIYTPQGTYYELRDKSHHGHLFCTGCLKVFCVPCPLPEDKPHQLLYWGKCNECGGNL